MVSRMFILDAVSQCLQPASFKYNYCDVNDLDRMIADRQPSLTPEETRLVFPLLHLVVSLPLI